MKKLTLIQYTDPMCIWCYALDGALRKLEFANADKIEFKNTLGLLVRDSREIIGDDEFALLRFKQLKAKMKEHFIDAAQRGGLPINTAHLEMKQASDITSLPASLAVMAMKIADESLQSAYLRRLREAFHSDGLNTSDERVLQDLASEFLSDLTLFKNALKGGEAQNELDKDIAKAYAKGIRAFPTIELIYNDKSQILQGFVEYDELKRWIETLANGDFILQEKDFSDENLLDFVERFARVSEREAQLALNTDKSTLRTCIEKLCKANLLTKQECGQSYFITLAHNESCKNGLCRV